MAGSVCRIVRKRAWWGKSCVGRISEFLCLEPGGVGVCSIPFPIARKFVGVDRHKVMLFLVRVMCGYDRLGFNVVRRAGMVDRECRIR